MNSKGRVVIAAVGVAVALGIAAEAASTAASSKTLAFKLKEKHDSRISGTATLTATKASVRVVLRLAGPVRGSSLAHIHTGPCRREPTFANPRIWLSLSNVARRRSVTALEDTTLAQLRARAFSINVHDPQTYGVVACGDIPRGGSR
jgi:hypothetical protein